MSDLYFAQYLLNTGEVTSDELPGLLAASVSADPELALLAMHEGLISGEQVAELGAAGYDTFPLYCTDGDPRSNRR